MTSSSVEMVNAFTSSTAQILSDAVPLWEVFLGLFLFAIVFGMLVKFLNRGVKTAFKK